MADVTFLRRASLVAGAVLLAAAVTAGHDHPSGEILGVLGLDVYASASGDVVDALIAVQEKGDPLPSVELRHTRSRDGGATWSRPVPILPGAARVFSPRRGAEPQIAASGDRLVVIWTEPGTSPWGSGPLASAVSADGGRTWKAGVSPADDGTTKDHGFVDVAAVSPNAFLAVWLDSRDGGQGLRSAVSKDGGVSWARNVDVERRTCECCANRLLVREDSVDVIYRARDPRDMNVARTTDGGASWTKLGPVARFGWEFDGCPEVAGALATTRVRGEERTYALAWTGKESDVGVWAVASDDQGRTWTKPGRDGERQREAARSGLEWRMRHGRVGRVPCRRQAPRGFRLDLVRRRKSLVQGGDDFGLRRRRQLSGGHCDAARRSRRVDREAARRRRRLEIAPPAGDDEERLSLTAAPEPST